MYSRLGVIEYDPDLQMITNLNSSEVQQIVKGGGRDRGFHVV